METANTDTKIELKATGITRKVIKATKGSASMLQKEPILDKFNQNKILFNILIQSGRFKKELKTVGIQLDPQIQGEKSQVRRNPEILLDGCWAFQDKRFSHFWTKRSEIMQKLDIPQQNGSRISHSMSNYCNLSASPDSPLSRFYCFGVNLNIVCMRIRATFRTSGLAIASEIYIVEPKTNKILKRFYPKCNIFYDLEKADKKFLLAPLQDQVTKRVSFASFDYSTSEGVLIDPFTSKSTRYYINYPLFDYQDLREDLARYQNQNGLKLKIEDFPKNDKEFLKDFKVYKDLILFRVQMNPLTADGTGRHLGIIKQLKRGRFFTKSVFSIDLEKPEEYTQSRFLKIEEGKKSRICLQFKHKTRVETEIIEFNFPSRGLNVLSGDNLTRKSFSVKFDVNQADTEEGRVGDRQLLDYFIDEKTGYGVSLTQRPKPANNGEGNEQEGGAQNEIIFEAFNLNES